MMKKNMGSADRVVRTVLAAIILMLFFTRTISGTWATVAVVVGGIFLATSLVGSCPLYTLFGIQTCRKK